MGLIIISLIVGGIGISLIRRDTLSTILTIIASLLIIIAIVGIVTGLMLPTGDYYPMEEVKTTQLRDLISNEVPLVQKCNNYAVSVVEEEECDNPRIVEYKQYAKPTFWSFGWGNRKESIIFYIPKNSLIDSEE